MGWRIRLHYETGDSFQTHEEDAYLESVWEDVEVVKENLRRIEEHYAYASQSDCRRGETYESAKGAAWMIDPAAGDNARQPADYITRAALMLRLDDGTEYQVGAFWCGYFERLLYIEAEQEGLRRVIGG